MVVCLLSVHTAYQR